MYSAKILGDLSGNSGALSTLQNDAVVKDFFLTMITSGLVGSYISNSVIMGDKLIGNSAKKYSLDTVVTFGTPTIKGVIIGWIENT